MVSQPEREENRIRIISARLATNIVVMDPGVAPVFRDPDSVTPDAYIEPWYPGQGELPL